MSSTIIVCGTLDSTTLLCDILDRVKLYVLEEGDLDIEWLVSFLDDGVLTLALCKWLAIDRPLICLVALHRFSGEP